LRDEFETTEKNFFYFKERVEHWQTYFGLLNYQISVIHESWKDSLAWCQADVTAGIATIAIATMWDDRPTRKQINKVAFHEVCELLLWNLAEHAESNHSDLLITGLKHDIIRRLENTLLKEKK